MTTPSEKFNNLLEIEKFLDEITKLNTKKPKGNLKDKQDLAAMISSLQNKARQHLEKFPEEFELDEIAGTNPDLFDDRNKSDAKVLSSGSNPNSGNPTRSTVTDGGSNSNSGNPTRSTVTGGGSNSNSGNPTRSTVTGGGSSGAGFNVGDYIGERNGAISNYNLDNRNKSLR